MISVFWASSFLPDLQVPGVSAGADKPACVGVLGGD